MVPVEVCSGKKFHFKKCTQSVHKQSFAYGIFCILAYLCFVFYFNQIT